MYIDIYNKLLNTIGIPFTALYEPIKNYDNKIYSN